MNPIVPKPQRCAIYTRKSTEHNLDLEFNSLDAQREACEAYIKSQAHDSELVPRNSLQGRQDLAEENTINVSTSGNSAAVASLDKDAPTDFSRIKPVSVMPRPPKIQEATVDPQPRGPDWMQITPKAGSLFHAYSQLELARQRADGVINRSKTRDTPVPRKSTEESVLINGRGLTVRSAGAVDELAVAFKISLLEMIV